MSWAATEALQGTDDAGRPVRFTSAWVVAIGWDRHSRQTYVKLLGGQVVAVPAPYEDVLAAIDSEVVTRH